MWTVRRKVAESDPIIALYAAVVVQAIRDMSRGDPADRESALRFLSEPFNQELMQMMNKEREHAIRSF